MKPVRWWADDRDVLEGEAEHDISCVAVASSEEYATMIAAALNVASQVAAALPERAYAVHILCHGAPLCRFAPQTPSRWPEGHAWVRNGEPGATCAGCLAAAS